ncbi:MAG: DNA topoisomerase IB [Ignavibacteriaceae bacterium]
MNKENSDNLKKNVRLCYVNDESPGYYRKKRGKGFAYFDNEEKKVKSKSIKKRFDNLVIPPAWTDVWICKKPNGHIQVTGRDAKERKQYIYHPKWEEKQNENKFSRTKYFGRNLPKIRRKIAKDLRKKNLTREKVLALIILLLEETLIRIGNDVYARENKSFGLTTLKNKHIEVNGSQICFSFKGKSGKNVEVDIKDKRLARIITQCQEIPGQHLFQFKDEDGMIHSITSNDVNEYIAEIAGEDFSAKDFRTWGGTVTAAKELFNIGDFETKKDGGKNIVQAVRNVAEALNNTPAVCRKYYIHPDILKSYLNKKLFSILQKEMGKKSSKFGLEPEEKTVLKVVK